MLFLGEKEGWRLCLEINLIGVLNGTTLAIARSSEPIDEGAASEAENRTIQPRPHEVTVVNVASILGLFNAEQPKGWAYNTSKSAVVTTSRCMASLSSNAKIVSKARRG